MTDAPLIAMSTTIYDVARRAGVSIATVSRVLNGTSPVSEEKRRAVVEAARALSYSPNPAALSLLNKETGGLGVLLPYVSGEFFAELLNGLDRAAQDHNYFLVVSTSHRRPTEFEAAIQALEKRVDGLVVMAPELDADGARLILRSATPVMFINTYLDELPADEHAVGMLNFDNYAGAYALTRHLQERGHRDIALIQGPPGAGDARERTRGYRAAMTEAGYADTAHLEFTGDFTQEAGYAAAGRILRATPRPTAVVAANDYCAIGVLSALHVAGLAIPEQMAVVGFDGIDSAQYAVPPLTTAQAPIREIGSLAIHRLVARLRDPERPLPPEHRVLPVNVLVRESTVASPN